MKYKKEHFVKLSQIIFNSLVGHKLIKLISTDAEIKKKIESVFLADSAKFDAINKKAKEMTEQYRDKIESGEIDYQKMFSMIKTQLLKQEGLHHSEINYSEDHIKSIALKIHDKLYLDEDVKYTDEEEALSQIQKDINEFVTTRDRLEDVVIKKIATLKKNVVPGTAEWHILFDKYMGEELQKHKL